ncbi:hypothetical protein O0L34_g3101 [Tuta absoluta]|nr:hypothetical protein O0L34_g3101 [Tuta absoluta]
MASPPLPVFLEGEVVKGFGRGSKQLGCPTANYNIEVVRSLPRELEAGVYCGWAQVDAGPVHKMVTNVGWCPFYQNKEMSVETHVLHKFDQDFYGSHLKIAIVGYLRGEKNFDSLDDLIAAIKQDIENGSNKLDEPFAKQIKNHSFFSS